MKWQARKVADVCRLINGRAYKKSELLAEGPYRVLRVGNFFTNDHWYYSDLELEPDKYCDNGDLLYAWSASFGPRIWAGEKVIYHYHIWKVEPRTDVVDPRFLFWYFEWDKERIKKDQGAGTTMIHVSKGSMEDRDIAVPPLPEQQRIVGLLDEAFTGIATAKANAEKNLRNARELFESELQAVFTERGDGWTDKPLGEIAEFKNGLNFSQSSKGQSVRVVGVGSFGENYIVPLADLQSVTIDDELDENYEIREHDLLTVRSNGSKDLVGRCMLVPAIEETISYSGFVIRIRPNTDVIVPRFLLHFMKSSDTRDRLTRGGGGANISNINQGKLSALAVPLPSLKAQQGIVEKFDRLKEETQRLESLYHQKLAALEALKKSLLHQAFSGQLTRKEPATIIEHKPIADFPFTIPGISTTDLHAGILAIAYERHVSQGKAYLFGHVKGEKIADSVERQLGISLGRNPVKDKKGPNDFPHLKKVEHRARMTNAFDFQQVEGAAYRVKKLRAFDRLVAKVRVALGERLAEVESLIDLMLKWDLETSEVFATVYAGWNNLLIDGKTPTDEEIVYESRENWHSEKLKIPRERFFKAIQFLRDQGRIPQGRGNRVEKRAT